MPNDLFLRFINLGHGNVFSWLAMPDVCIVNKGKDKELSIVSQGYKSQFY